MTVEIWRPDLLVLLAVVAFPASIYLASRKTPVSADGYWAIFFGTCVISAGLLLEYVEDFHFMKRLFPIAGTRPFNWVVAGLFVAPGSLLTVWGLLQWLPKVNGMAAEIQRRAEVEQELRDSEERFRVMVEHAPEAITLVDAETGKYVACNPAAERLHGYSQEELRNSIHPLDLSPATQPDGTPSAAGRAAKLNAAWEGQVPNFEWLHRDRYGRERLCQVSLIRLPGHNSNLIRANIQDITERKQTEDMLRRMQKMEALSVLSSGAAHDFNNLLAIIDGSARLIESDAPEDQQLVEDITTAVQRGTQLTRGMLTFAREQPATPRHVVISEVITPFAEVLQRTLGAGIKVSLDLSDDLWPSLVDASQLEDAILNLSINARDAMQGQGQLQIACHNAVLAADRAMTIPAANTGEFVELSVADSGEGIAPEHLNRVFEPYYSTKGPQKGSGLGLAMVLEFASQSNGFVDIQSTPGQGTTVSVFLPRAAQDS